MLVNVPEFQRKNPIKTNLARQEADRVPPYVINDPTPIQALADRLSDLIEEISKSKTIDDLPDGLSIAWKLEPAAFDEIRAAADTPERHEELERRIARAFDPLIRDGVLGPNTLPQQEDGTRELRVRDAGDPPSKARRVPRERVALERIANPDAPVFKRFTASFGSPRVGEVLFGLIANRLKSAPTLSFDEKTTAAVREEARRDPRRLRHLSARRSSRRPRTADQRGTTHSPRPGTRRLQRRALTAVQRLRCAGSIAVLVAALFALIGYYIHRHEPLIALSSAGSPSCAPSWSRRSAWFDSWRCNLGTPRSSRSASWR